MLFKFLVISLSVSWAISTSEDVTTSVGVLPPFDPSGPPPVSNVTTTPPSTTTTTKPITSTTSKTPTTTRTPAPTPKPTTPTTTVSPPTTTVSPPTPGPKPDNKLSVNDYSGNYTNTSTICLMAKIAIEVEILAKDNKTSTIINVPKNVTYEVLCSPSDPLEYLTVSWNGVNGSNIISFQLFNNNSKFEIQSINTTLTWPGSNASTFYHNKAEFAVSDTLSYYCLKEQLLNLTDGGSNDTVAKLHLSHLHYQAFMNTTTDSYSSVWDCDGANTSDVVPVVVGCVLASLVVLVLAAYVLGRCRQARGYHSMNVNTEVNTLL